MKKRVLTKFDFIDISYFILTCDRKTVENLAQELDLPNSGSPYFNWGNIKIIDVLKALEKNLKIKPDKRKQVKSLLKVMGYLE